MVGHRSHHSKLPVNSSPLFPREAFSPVDSSFVEENELISSGSVSLSIVLAESILFLRGFTAQEFTERTPSLLRGTLVVRAHKPVKIKAISLTFKGIARTEWPEGIPPKKSELFESKELHSHTWPFFNASFPMADVSSGANMIRASKGTSHHRTPSADVFVKGHHSNNSSSSSIGSGESDHTSPSTLRPDSMDSTRKVRGLAGRLKRAASPTPSFPKENILHSLNLGPRRSFSKDEPVETETHTKGYRTFETGEYFYNFELPIPQSLPESIEGSFGSVRYFLEASIDRPGAFRTKVSGVQTVTLIRCPADNNTEINEPIAICKQWEDQLAYDIVVSGKTFTIGGKIPIAFKLTPLAKIQLHRVRVYITENCEYFCRDKRVHRMEPTKKFLLEERISKDGLGGNLLMELTPGMDSASGELLSSSTELEINPEIPLSFPKRREILHPDSTYDNVKIHHWIKLAMRVSKTDPKAEPEEEGKKKHYEISIESPIHLLDPRCTNANVYLPAYIDPVSRRASTISLRAVPSGERPEARPIHFLRKPSIAPPPFGADVAPPPLARAPSREAPPNYESATENQTSYVERFASYQQQRSGQSDTETEASAVVQRQRNLRGQAPILDTLQQHSEAAQDMPPSPIQVISGRSSTSLSTSTSSETQDSASITEPSSVEPSLLNTEIFVRSSSAAQAVISTPASSTGMPRLQTNPSSTSVDIVDQSFVDPDDPLFSQMRPVVSTASSITPSLAANSSSKLEDLLPKLYLGGHSLERSPLLGHANSGGGGGGLNGGAGGVTRRVSEISVLSSVPHGANALSGPPSSRGRFDSSADLGMRGGAGGGAGGYLDDDQISMTSNASLWIS